MNLATHIPVGYAAALPWSLAGQRPAAHRGRRQRGGRRAPGRRPPAGAGERLLRLRRPRRGVGHRAAPDRHHARDRAGRRGRVARAGLRERSPGRRGAPPGHDRRRRPAHRLPAARRRAGPPGRHRQPRRLVAPRCTPTTSGPPCWPRCTRRAASTTSAPIRCAAATCWRVRRGRGRASAPATSDRSLRRLAGPPCRAAGPVAADLLGALHRADRMGGDPADVRRGLARRLARPGAGADRRDRRAARRGRRSPPSSGRRAPSGSPRCSATCCPSRPPTTATPGSRPRTATPGCARRCRRTTAERERGSDRLRASRGEQVADLGEQRHVGRLAGASAGKKRSLATV